jgi:hypothetical protein
MQRDGVVLNMLLRIFLRVITQSLQSNSPGAAQLDRAALHIGAVAFIHRFGSSLNEHVHLKSDAKEMLAYQHSGFSVDAGVCIEAPTPIPGARATAVGQLRCADGCRGANRAGFGSGRTTRT